MSVIGASVGRAVGTMGGPTTAAALVAGGIVIGALGGGFLANGGFGGSSVSSAGQLAVYPCPETGPLLTYIKAGQKVLATGRNGDSTWLRIHYPSPGRPEAWVEAGQLTVEGSVAALPVAECIAELAIAPPALAPEESMTVTQNNPPSAGPTPTATATLTPTPTPTTNARPNVAALTASTRQINFDTGNYCPNAVKSVTFRVKATDAVGVTGVTLSWREPGAAAFAQAAMNRVSGTSKDGFWQATLNTAGNGIDRAGNLAYFATARDGGGATRRIPASTSNAIQVNVCENPGPVMSGAASSSGANLFWDPLGVGSCQTATNITATIRDSDGIGSATLFYRRPGDGGFQSKPMNNTTVPGKWFANLDTLGDKITIPNPPTGTLRWYIRTVDKKGAATVGLTRTIAIRRCDSEATFFVNSMSQGNNYCPPQTTSVRITWQFSIDDPDAMVSATLRYTVVPDSFGPTITRSATVNVTNGRFNMQSVPLDGQAYYDDNQVTWTITTRDRYGGTSSDSSKGNFQIWVC